MFSLDNEFDPEKNHTYILKLYDSCRAGDSKFGELLLKAIELHIDINTQIYEQPTLLWYACHAEYIDKVKLLLDLDLDIDVNIQSPYDKTTPLSIACQKENTDMVELLLNSNADTNIPDRDNCTPLWHVCRSRNYKIVELLLNHGADSDMLDENNPHKTPLWHACRMMDFKLIELLYSYGANFNMILQDTTELSLHLDQDFIDELKEWKNKYDHDHDYSELKPIK
jgi:ankyrin repeat protein